uniref:Lipid-binding serum glycoprotein C-terminal domain-containing protein n=1 Tax=Ditylenchus dipsaci TaxID=166011 RepID=A0A915CN49_9BILA
MYFQHPLRHANYIFFAILFCRNVAQNHDGSSESEASTPIRTQPLPPRSPTLNAGRSPRPIRPNSGEAFVRSNETFLTNFQQQEVLPFANSTDNLTTINLIGRKEEPYVGITLRPLSPNLLLLNIFAFDVDITGLLNGNVQLLLTPVPVSGNIIVGSRQLSITAAFDLQKNQLKVPFLRMQSCELRSGFVNTHVSDLGLLTDSINLKYKTEMVTKAKEMITSTICNQIEQTIKAQVNERLRRMPRHISVATILSIFSKEDKCPPSTPQPCENNQQASFSATTETIRHDRRLTPKFYDYLHSQNYPFVQHWTQKIRRKRQSHNNRGQQLSHSSQSNNAKKTKEAQKDNDRGIATISEIIPEMEDEEDVEQEQLPKLSSNPKKPEMSKRHYVITSLSPKQTSALVNSSKEALKKSSSAVLQKRQRPKFRLRQEPENKSTDTNDSGEDTGSVEIFRRPDNSLEVRERVSNQKSRGELKKGKTNDTIKEEGKGTPVVNKDMGDLGVLLQFLDLNALGRIFIDLDFLDSSAGSDSFGVGINGDVFLKGPQPITYVNKGVREVLILASQGKLRKDNTSQASSFSSDKETPKDEKSKTDSTPQNNFDLQDMLELLQPPKLKFPNNSGADDIAKGSRKTLEMIFSELQPNLVLLQAHRARLLSVRLGPGSPFFGNLLKTTCSIDEICLSDSIPEAGERYPNKILEVQLETIRPPKISVTKDLAKLSFIGSATFLLADGTHQPIGRIPFATTIQLAVKMFRPDSPRLDVALNIIKLEILEDVDFFELSTETLRGFRDAIKGAIENTAKKVLVGGVDTRPLANKLKRYGLSKFGLSLLNGGLVLLQADVDVYKLVFEEDEETERTANNANFAQFQPPLTPPVFG